MSFLFNSFFTVFIVFIVMLILVFLPIRIKVLYQKEHIPKKGYLGIVTKSIYILALVLVYIYAIVTADYNDLMSLFMLLILAGFAFSYVKNTFFTKIKSIERKVYYANKDVSQLIYDINWDNPKLNINKEFTSSPVTITI